LYHHIKYIEILTNYCLETYFEYEYYNYFNFELSNIKEYWGKIMHHSFQHNKKCFLSTKSAY